MYEYWLNNEDYPQLKKESQKIINNNQKFLLKTMCQHKKCDENEKQLKISSKEENDVMKILNTFEHKEL